MAAVQSPDRPELAGPDPLTRLRELDSRSLGERTRALIGQRWKQYRPLTGPAAGLIVACSLVVVLVGWRLVVDSQPPIEESLPVARAPQPDPTTEVASTTLPADGGDRPTAIVHVAGAVRAPGLVVGQADWRVADAVAAAGGAQADADLDRINLAAVIVDGERIFVPFSDEPVPPPVNAGSPTGEAAVGPVDINSADAEALETLPGVGPSTAAAIIAHRAEHGSFGGVDGLVAVRGIGPATLDSLRDHITAR